jgi:hypothetical protein
MWLIYISFVCKLRLKLLHKIDSRYERPALSAFLCPDAQPTLSLLSSKRLPETKRCMDAFDYAGFMRNLRFAYTLIGSVSQGFLGITFFLYLTLPELRNFQGSILQILAKNFHFSNRGQIPTLCEQNKLVYMCIVDNDLGCLCILKPYM